MKRFLMIGLLVALLLPLSALEVRAQDFEIVVDYTYDTNGFFNPPERRVALTTAAQRYSDIINSPLTAVGPAGTSGSASNTPAGWRIGFTNPTTGASFQLSTAVDEATDPLKGLPGSTPADVYKFGGLGANQWTLFAGARQLGLTAGQGGTGTGLNFTSTFQDESGPMRRGVISETSSNTVNDLPAWGGSISFDIDTLWHFGINDASAPGEVDFYSIALHEIGHALGLATSWNQFQPSSAANTFAGPEALAAYNADNHTSLTALNLEAPGNPHWKDGTYKSNIFAAGNPNLAGTVGLNALQDLLMEPTANFINPTLRRFELTNTDVAALRDIGWSTVTAIPEPSGIALLLLTGTVVGLRRRRAA